MGFSSFEEVKMSGILDAHNPMTETPTNTGPVEAEYYIHASGSWANDASYVVEVRAGKVSFLHQDGRRIPSLHYTTGEVDRYRKRGVWKKVETLPWATPPGEGELAELIWNGLMDNGREPTLDDAHETARRILSRLPVAAGGEEDHRSEPNDLTASERTGTPAPPSLLSAVADAIEAAGCPGREGPFGGYDYSSYGAAKPYQVRDFRDPRSADYGKTIFASTNQEETDAEFRRLTREHIAQAALDAAAQWSRQAPAPDGAERVHVQADPHPVLNKESLPKEPSL